MARTKATEQEKIVKAFDIIKASIGQLSIDNDQLATKNEKLWLRRMSQTQLDYCDRVINALGIDKLVEAESSINPAVKKR